MPYASSGPLGKYHASWLPEPFSSDADAQLILDSHTETFSFIMKIDHRRIREERCLAMRTRIPTASMLRWAKSCLIPQDTYVYFMLSVRCSQAQ